MMNHHPHSEADEQHASQASKDKKPNHMQHFIQHYFRYSFTSWASYCILSRRVVGLLMTGLLIYLSKPVVMNILSEKQVIP